jgi:hypothetical protein
MVAAIAFQVVAQRAGLGPLGEAEGRLERAVERVLPGCGGDRLEPVRRDLVDDRVRDRLAQVRVAADPGVGQALERAASGGTA